MMVQGREDDVYALMLFGTVERPIPSYLHLKRECFVLSSVTKLPAERFDGRKLYRKKEDGQLHITKSGKALFKNFLETHSNEPEVIHCITTVIMVRELYDTMSAEEISYLESR